MAKGWMSVLGVGVVLILSACHSTYHHHDGDDYERRYVYEEQMAARSGGYIPDSGDMDWTAPKGEKFDNHLAEGYSLMAKQAEFERDFHSVEQFRYRAWMARQGRLIPPESLGARSLPNFAVGELTDARRWLMDALARGAAEVFPWEAAQAQLSFDCWMEEQEENIQQSDIDECRDRFYTAMKIISQSEVQNAQPASCSVGASCGCAQHRGMCGGADYGSCNGQCAGASTCEHCGTMPAKSFTFLFHLDSTVMVPESQAEFERMVRAIERYQPEELDMRGHTDLSGSQVYNRDLSKRRLEAIIAKLAQRGINDIPVVGDYYGERAPAVQTADGVRSEANRRVEVFFK